VHWNLDPQVVYLNHGAYGACPGPVLAVQAELRARMERELVRFFAEDLEGLLSDARGRLGAFIGADPDDLAFMPNATTGVNTVLRSLAFGPGDEILTTDHEYNACLNTIRFVAQRSGATVVEAELPLPVDRPRAITDAILDRVTPRTRLAVISHVTSPTALIFPIAEIVAALGERGVDTLVDAAHPPGMVPLDVESIGAAYYAGNAHKWLCAPKGAGFLHVRRDRQERIRPLVISHGANSPRTEIPRFRLEFDWLGTVDPTAYLAIPAAIDFIGSLVDGGWPQVMARNRQLVLEGRSLVSEALRSTGALAPEEMIGSIAAIELPDDLPPTQPLPSAGATTDSTYPLDPLHERLLHDFSIEVPVYAWPHTPAARRPRHRLLRISAQLYNSRADYELLAAALTQIADEDRAGS
jgi:isopenicillin-N epimerase